MWEVECPTTHNVMTKKIAERHIVIAGLNCNLNNEHTKNFDMLKPFHL